MKASSQLLIDLDSMRLQALLLEGRGDTHTQEVLVRARQAVARLAAYSDPAKLVELLVPSLTRQLASHGVQASAEQVVAVASNCVYAILPEAALDEARERAEAEGRPVAAIAGTAGR